MGDGKASDGKARKPADVRRDHGGAKDDKSPKKRRKVNHACVYCRRSHMTCDLVR